MHSGNPDAATEKAMDLVRMAVAKAALLTPLQEVQLEVTSGAMVIGGGGRGHERGAQPGGSGIFLPLGGAGQRPGRQRPQPAGDRSESAHRSLPGGTQGKDRGRAAHHGASEHRHQGCGRLRGQLQDHPWPATRARRWWEHGVALICTGAGEYKPAEYLYGQDPRVMTHLEIDQAVLNGDLDLGKINKAVFIQCVGSRDPERPYCSKVCCTHSVESALAIKEANPEAQVVILYRDIRTFGERELLYKEARSKGVLFVRYDLEQKPTVEAKDGGLIVKVRDHILDRDLLIEADLVGLATAIVSHKAGDLRPL